MAQQLVQSSPAAPLTAFADRLPPMIAVDERTAWRFVDFFAVTIRNPNTREAYYPSGLPVHGQVWGLHGLGDVMPIHVAAYVEHLPLSRALCQATPVHHQPLLRLAGVWWDPPDQPGDFGPETQACRKDR